MDNRVNDYKLILWDIDGTLMHCGSDGTKALNRSFKELYGIDDAFAKAGIGSAMDAVILERIMDNFNLDKNGLDELKKTYVSILREILHNNKEKKILPGVKAILEHIKNTRDFFNALLTSNLRIGAETKLKSVGLHNYFEVGGFGDILGEKWDAAVNGIREAEEHFGVRFSNNNIYLIGDSIYDIECAKRIGVKSIGVATGWMEYEVLKNHEPDYLYRDLSDWQEIVFVKQPSDNMRQETE